ncbi:hypothetical protein [Uliginosibacterium sp. 31-12]|uniref:hypothetical protein n=1 Tax=Uliginosibacterium sp. 31-12 TaxID=3062781 RepID=UPI0026E26A91|nr:hypothetical protein [Uliginosibacterium sp. 31-12]MDO6388477.1 hypothetical protein [Uliginosibacterium sp. 31-12]
MKTVLFAVAVMLLPGLATSQTPLQQSHIEANVPSQSNFAAFLDRDLLAYFKGAGFPSALTVESQLLRKEPTQSGVAYPKYYAWVKINNGSQLLSEGAVRVAAIEQKRFEVTKFLSRKQIQSNLGEVAAVFPSALVPTIISLAEAK